MCEFSGDVDLGKCNGFFFSFTHFAEGKLVSDLAPPRAPFLLPLQVLAGSQCQDSYPGIPAMSVLQVKDGSLFDASVARSALT